MTKPKDTIKQDPTAAAEGLNFTAEDGTEWTVAPSCSDNRGQWYCTTHRKPFRNNFDKDSHIQTQTGGHVLAWVCFEHGPEVP